MIANRGLLAGSAQLTAVDSGVRIDLRQAVVADSRVRIDSARAVVADSGVRIDSGHFRSLEAANQWVITD